MNELINLWIWPHQHRADSQLSKCFSSLLKATYFHGKNLHDAVRDRGIDHGIGEFWPPPQIGWVRLCHNCHPSPLKYHFFTQNRCWTTLQTHNRKDQRLVSKMEGKTNFARDVKQFDGLTRPGLKVGPGRRPGTLWFAGSIPRLLFTLL